ncbi:class I SAM-dependent methyltransferase [Actinomadura sp. ATCC 31491]|uniref:Class I SAM-dependent methyltransferase n=1 Tax=Actinomadura luzonensis TaxID=2805427 RepID=A0ABT0G262_9ACTN|nr:class I SAM-dependent methyltransferase [Actinomadura luzonensis]MCK2218191.1 class I SAM-dependent methyltransferase [Actinomadura luzonensis]
MNGNPYETIGLGYSQHRRPDPRIAGQIEQALGSATTVVNVGAGTGSYEPRDRRVTAVEPSTVMMRQRPPGSAPVVQGYAESLPFPDRSFDAAMAILTVHHWTDPAAGLAELRRVSARQVVLTWDPAVTARFWLVEEYLPQISEAEAGLASLDLVQSWLRREGAQVSVVPVPVAADCTDGFLGAYWRRPHRYLDPRARAAVSALANLDQHLVERAMRRLEIDLATGHWHERHRDLLDSHTLDLGYRLVTAAPPAGADQTGA